MAENAGACAGCTRLTAENEALRVKIDNANVQLEALHAERDRQPRRDVLRSPLQHRKELNLPW